MIHKIVYPWGNPTPARVIDVNFANDEIRYVVEFLTDNIADFGWYKYLIFAKGEVIENLREEHLFDDPRTQR